MILKLLKKLFEKKNVKTTEPLHVVQPLVKKRFCAKPMGEICFGNETDERCNKCMHWI